MKPRTAIIILIIVFLLTAIVFWCWYLYTHKTVKPKIHQNNIYQSQELTPEEEVKSALEKMRNNSNSRANEQKVLNSLNKMR